jgi:Tol biopolymer transport system component
MTQRRIEPLGGDASAYTDGQRAVYHDDAANALVISDLDGRNKRVVFKAKPGESLYRFLPSRDSSMVYLLLAPGGQVTHAVVNIDGTGYRELFQGSPYSGLPPAWSWDNRYLLFSGAPPSPIGVFSFPQAVLLPWAAVWLQFSVSDGKSREVVRRDGAIWQGAFSPDGRFIAFRLNDSVLAGGTGKIFVVPFQGGEARLGSDDANLLDWTRDGRYLAVSSQRSGSRALYLLPMRDGQPSGDPVFVRYGAFLPGSDTQSNGALF